MKYQEELTLITYKIGEIREDLKELTQLEKRISKLEKFMFCCMGAISILGMFLPLIFVFFKH